MASKRKRKSRPIAIPCLVLSQIVPDSQIALLTALNAFREGWATPAHFDVMLDTRDLLLLGASAKEDEGVMAVCRAANIALANIQDSYNGAFKFDQEELNALVILVDISNDFWNRQSGSLYRAAYTALRQWRQKQGAENEGQRNERGTH